MGMKAAGGGEIIQVQGGHIVRSVGRKDRHSKVYTAKGPRDRRVRLSAHTAIQFYDVQDRLGYDRPSKAVDWLMKKAKSSIDKLDQLPPWNPADTLTGDEPENEVNGISSLAEPPESSGYCNFNNSSFAPAPIDNSGIVDSMKAFFPVSSGSCSMNFQTYPDDIIQRQTNPDENLCLSLHSYQNPDLINNHHHHSPENSMGYDTNFQRMVGWNNTTSFHQQLMVGQNSAFSQRGTLQSSFSTYDNIPIGSVDHQKIPIFGSRFTADGLPGFFIPARIHGEEDDRVVSNRPSSDSPSS